MSRAGSLCRVLGTLVKRNKNQPSQPGQLGSQYCDAGIPGGNFPSNHAGRAALLMSQARNRTVGHTLLIRIASNLYLKMEAPGWSFSCSMG